MAAFSSNIDITSGGTYGMDVTNGESSLKVANDLNGKMANIQQYLQNGLPEVWTGDSLPDSLPNGKILIWDNKLYLNNNDNISTIDNIVYGEWMNTNGQNPVTINLGIPFKYMIVSVVVMGGREPQNTITLIVPYNTDSSVDYYGFYKSSDKMYSAFIYYSIVNSTTITIASSRTSATFSGINYIIFT